MKEVWNLTCDTPGQKIVLLALADCEREDAGCWPSLSTLQKKCSMSRQGILNQIGALEKRGWISVERGDGKSSLYRITIPVHAMDYLPEKMHAFKPINGHDQSTQLTSPLNGHPVVHAVDQHQSTELTTPVHAMDSNHKEPKVEPKIEPAAKEEAICERFMTRWNKLPDPFPKVQTMSQGRKTSLRARLRDKFWKENFEPAMQIMEKSLFLLGKNQRGWVADVEFFLRPDSVAKIIEGKYLKSGLDEPAPEKRKDLEGIKFK